MEQKRLSDILTNSELEQFEQDWYSAEAAPGLKPIPPDIYKCRVVNGVPKKNARSGKPSYKLTLEVVEGEYTGRLLWHDIWMTKDAMPIAKRELAKLGVTHLEQLDRPLPPGIILTVSVSIWRSDKGREFNQIDRFDVVAIEPPTADPFAPPAEGPGGATADADGFDWQSGEQRPEGPTT
jgi:hypothetical protein